MILRVPLRVLALALRLHRHRPRASPRASTEPQPTSHEFVLHNFHTESGAVLPETHILYGTYGHLNADRLQRHAPPLALHGGAAPDTSWLIGPGNRALDPNQLFLVTSELFGNGSSSSPSNTPEALPRPPLSRS